MLDVFKDHLCITASVSIGLRGQHVVASPLCAAACVGKVVLSEVAKAGRKVEVRTAPGVASMLKIPVVRDQLDLIPSGGYGPPLWCALMRPDHEEAAIVATLLLDEGAKPLDPEQIQSIKSLNVTHPAYVAVVERMEVGFVCAMRVRLAHA